MKSKNGSNRISIVKIMFAIAGLTALAASAFLITPAFLVRFTNDGIIDESKFYHIRLLRIVLVLAGAALLCATAASRRVEDAPERAGADSAPGVELFIVSFLILFLELALIRWIPAYVKVMTYFSNFILLAAFLGMGLGCLTASSRRRLLRVTPLVLAAVVLISLALYSLAVLTESPFIVGGIGGREMVYFGIELSAAASQQTIEAVTVVITGALFVLVTLIFVGPGQKLGSLFERFDNPVKAYCINIGASMTGIVCIGALSFLSVPASVWFAMAGLLLVWLIARDNAGYVPAQAVILAIIFAASLAGDLPAVKSHYIWSPYYRIYYEHPTITVNQIGHQSMFSARGGHEEFYYHLPYLLERDAAHRGFKDALVIGAGSGNDVSHALLHGANHVDAVEIDPIILDIGKKNHPDRPYADSRRVRIINDDGRSFLKCTPHKYDLVVYALVDSLTLMSSFSSVRLENYLFTEDAFREIKARLKPGGVFVVYNGYRENWLAVRLYRMLEHAFGTKPVLVLLPPEREISEAPNGRQYAAMFLAGDITSIRKEFEKNGGAYTLLKNRPDLERKFNGFADVPRGRASLTVYSTRVAESVEPQPPRDDRPFFYLRKPQIPKHNIWGLALVAAVSVIGAAAAVGARGVSRISMHFFFLGCAFMLLETQSIVKLALIHGSTWFVNSVVFVCVLIMVLGANLIVLRKPLRSTALVYALLFLSLAANYFVQPAAFLGRGFLLESVISSALLFVPLLFAGIIFANSFRISKRPELDLGSNLLGVIAGGIAEYAALVFGYNALILIAAAMYAVAMASRPGKN